jgi:hypothetical protein
MASAAASVAAAAAEADSHFGGSGLPPRHALIRIAFRRLHHYNSFSEWREKASRWQVTGKGFVKRFLLAELWARAKTWEREALAAALPKNGRTRAPSQARALQLFVVCSTPMRVR